jgi:hypothetical protein
LIVILEDPIFDSRHTLALQSVLRLGLEGWHRVQTDPPYDPSADRAVNRWLKAQDAPAQEAIVLTFEIGLEDDALGIPADLAVRVGAVGAPDWSAKPPRLPIAVAVAWLHRPLRLLVENLHNDGAFLRTVAPRPWREKLHQALEKGQIEISHGGGSDMRSQIEGASRRDALRLWALSDSDAREPGQPSAAAARLRQLCSDRDVAHHLLSRRTIENYLPIKALEAWAHMSPSKHRTPRRRSVAAYAGMSPAHRHHFNLKKGFEGDRASGIPSYYAPHVESPDLQRGFGANIADLFHQREFPLHEEWLAKDGQQPEMIDMVQSIFRRL